MTKDEAVQAIRERRPEDNIATLLKAAGLPRRWTQPVTIEGRELTPEREIAYLGACPERGLAHKLRAEYPRWEVRKREYALDAKGRRKKDPQGGFIVKRDRQTAEAWMGRIRCEGCGMVYNVDADLVAAFADDLAAYDDKHRSGSSSWFSRDWGEHNHRLDEAEKHARKLAENPPPKRRMC